MELIEKSFKIASRRMEDRVESLKAKCQFNNDPYAQKESSNGHQKRYFSVGKIDEKFSEHSEASKMSFQNKKNYLSSDELNLMGERNSIYLNGLQKLSNCKGRVLDTLAKTKSLGKLNFGSIEVEICLENFEQSTKQKYCTNELNLPCQEHSPESFKTRDDVTETEIPKKNISNLDYVPHRETYEGHRIDVVDVNEPFRGLKAIAAFEADIDDDDIMKSEGYIKEFDVVGCQRSDDGSMPNGIPINCATLVTRTHDVTMYGGPNANSIMTASGIKGTRGVVKNETSDAIEIIQDDGVTATDNVTKTNGRTKAHNVRKAADVIGPRDVISRCDVISPRDVSHGSKRVAQPKSDLLDSFDRIEILSETPAPNPPEANVTSLRISCNSHLVKPPAPGKPNKVSKRRRFGT